MGKTKKQLRGDRFLEFLQSTMDSVRPYTTVALAGAVVVIVTITVWLTFAVRSERREQQALAALGRAETVEQLQALPESYLQTSAGPMILFNLAQKLQEQDGSKHYDQLVSIYGRLLALNPSDYFTLLAHMSLGKLYVEKGEFDKALTEFQAAGQSPLTSERTEAIWYMGWCCEKLGRTGEALEAYLKVKNEPLRGRLWREQAAFRISQLEKQSGG